MSCSRLLCEALPPLFTRSSRLEPRRDTRHQPGSQLSLKLCRRRPCSFAGVIAKIDIWRAAQLMLKRYGEKALGESAAGQLALAGGGRHPTRTSSWLSCVIYVVPEMMGCWRNARGVPACCWQPTSATAFGGLKWAFAGLPVTEYDRERKHRGGPRSPHAGGSLFEQLAAIGRRKIAGRRSCVSQTTSRCGTPGVPAASPADIASLLQ